MKRFPDAAQEIRQRAVEDGSYYLIPYREVGAFREREALYAELNSHELCWTDSPPASLPEFTSLIQRQWARFAELASRSEEVYVLEAVLFQHQIHDMLGHYQASDRLIKEHIRGIADRIAALNPVLLYLTHPSVREQQIWISSIRSRPRFATESNIRFMENRKRIELSLLDKLPFPAYIIENPSLDWDDVMNQMVRTVDQAYK
ncbi:hypothetical protein MJA45_04090 [Paenibacillus aurantius]|uniref:Uncharacterized protein n=1 Tax=Paenibacillus aurantius TaxID=2918900 RepID=A0AA96RII6_9BACL|nr:hypothetical protein [Paenibacillus aurantius]WNQ12239.1 hypothetical protein MJA45_04090 [Paenibacillus aurantius]